MRATLILIFFLSGAAALVFETLWFRLAGLSLGNSVWSASLVLAAFMAGLALGNGLVARLHQRVLKPIRLYAGLEIAIGVGGIAALLILPRLTGVFGPLFGSLGDAPALLNTIRVTISFIILLTPAIAMGATLPVLTRALSGPDANFGANLGQLYGWNTLGAMTGAITAELILVPALGVLASGFFALGLNLVAAVIALRMSKTYEVLVSSPVAPTPARETISTRGRRLLAVAFLSGALMLALEVVWFRFLLLTLDGTSLIFAVMLAVVLGGIAVGGLVGGKLFQRDDKAYRWLRAVTSASAAMVVLTYWGYDFFDIHLARRNTTIPEFIGYCVFLMFPVSMLSGIAFTMVARAAKDDIGSSVRTTGIATLYNTIGAAIGSLLAGFVLLPTIGMEFSFFVVAAGYCLVAFVVPSESETAEDSILWTRGAAVAAVASLVLFPFGTMMNTHFAPQAAARPNHTLISAREGLVETLRYYSRDVFGQPMYYRLVTNGHSMSATSTSAKRYMKLYVYLPMALNPDTRDALLISYGVASTAKALTDTKSLEKIDIVDISEEILEMSSIIYPGDENPLRDERVQVHIEDGRFFLNTTTERYDLITSEPPPPKMAGVVNLYSQEYFELIRSRLNPGGYVTYWLPVQQLHTTDTLAITSAFCNAFENCSLWAGAGLEWMLVGTNGAPSRPDIDGFSAQWQDPVTGPELVALGFEKPEQFGSLFMADSAMLQELTAHVPPVTDNYPSRISSRMVEDFRFIELYDDLMDEHRRLERFMTSDQIDRLWPAGFKEQSEPYFRYERMIKNYFTDSIYQRPADPFVWEAIDELLTDTSLKTLPLWLMGSNHAIQGVIDSLIEQQGFHDAFTLELARRHTAERDFETALTYAHAHISNSENVSERATSLYLYLLAKNGRLEQAAPLVSNLRSLERPSVDAFLDWYTTEFSGGATVDSGPAYISDP